jgi:RNA polymerase sigma-70 factor, ECF subfamily
MALPFLSTPSPYPATCDAIYRAHLRDVVRWTRRFGAPARDAEDIAQIVFVALHRAILEKRFTLGGNPGPWLRKTTFRITRDYVQTLRRQGSPMELQGGLEPMDGRADAERRAQVAQAADELDDLLESLDYDCRAVFVLHELEQLPLPQIAEELEIKLTTARWRLRVARQHFDEALRRKRAADRRKYGAGAVILPLSAEAILRRARALPPASAPGAEERVWARIQKEIGLRTADHLRPERPHPPRARPPRAPRSETLIIGALLFVVGVMAGAMGLDALRQPPPPRPLREPAPILAIAPPVDDSFLASLPDPAPNTTTASATPVSTPPADAEAEAEAEMLCLHRANKLLPGRPREALAELARCEQRFTQTRFPAQRDQIRRDAGAALSRTR